VLNFDVSEEWAKQRGEDKEYNSSAYKHPFRAGKKLSLYINL